MKRLSNMTKLLQIIMLALLIIGCSSRSSVVQNPIQTASHSDLNSDFIVSELSTVGTLTYQSIEGGFYSLETESENYVILNANDFDLTTLEDKTVSIEAYELNVVTIFMAGSPVFVTLVDSSL